MNSASSSNKESSRSLSEIRVQDVLLEIEQSAIDAQVWFETESGAGEVLFSRGHIVAARLGGARGKTALLHLLSLSEGTYGIKRCTVANDSPIIRNVAALCELHQIRHAKWVQLCSTAPQPSSVLTLTADGKTFRDASRGIQRVVLALIDGTRTVIQLLEESSFDPLDTLATITQAIRNDFARVAQPATSLFPLVPMTAAAEPPSLGPCTPFTQSDASVRSVSVAPYQQRRATLKGLGVQQPSIILAPTPIITISEETEPDHASPLPARMLPVSHRPSLDGAGSKSAKRQYIDRYEILLPLGRGHASTVYIARPSANQLGFRRLCALRLFHSRLLGDDLNAFLQSARVASTLHHANVACVYDAGLHEDQPYVVMDYVEGCPLDALIPGVARTPAYLILPIVIDALSGLQAAHSLQDELRAEGGFLQYEVTPHNILVGTDGTCRLADFGFTSQALQSFGTIPLAKAGYIAPERITGDAPDHRADIFSMGVILWNALTGTRLFPGATTDEVLERVCSGPIRPPSLAGAHTSPALDAIVMRSLARNPLNRFVSAEEMLTVIGRFATSLGGMAAPQEIASCVREAVGTELTERRLTILDASREIPTADTATAQNKEPAHVMASGPPLSELLLRAQDGPNLSESMRTSGVSMFYAKQDFAALTAASFAGDSENSPPVTRKSKRLRSLAWTLVALLAVLVSTVIVMRMAK